MRTTATLAVMVSLIAFCYFLVDKFPVQLRQSDSSEAAAGKYVEPALPGSILRLMYGDVEGVAWESEITNEVFLNWHENASVAEEFREHRDDSTVVSDVLWRNPANRKFVDGIAVKLMRLISTDALIQEMTSDSIACLFRNEGTATKLGEPDEFGFAQKMPDIAARVSEKLVSSEKPDRTFVLYNKVTFGDYKLDEAKFSLVVSTPPVVRLTIGKDKIDVTRESSFLSSTPGAKNEYVVSERPSAQLIELSNSDGLENISIFRTYVFEPPAIGNGAYNYSDQYSALDLLQTRFRNCVKAYPDNFADAGLQITDHVANFDFRVIILDSQGSNAIRNMEIPPSIARGLKKELMLQLTIDTIGVAQSGGIKVLEANLVSLMGTYMLDGKTHFIDFEV